MLLRDREHSSTISSTILPSKNSRMMPARDTLNPNSPIRGIDASLYLVINPEQCRHLNPIDLAAKAVAGGVSTVQVRSKSMSDHDYGLLVEQIVRALRPYRIPVFVNDRVAVAVSARVDCIHLGQSDETVGVARSRLGDQAHIGLTVRSMEEAMNAPLEELSYVSVGGVFSTRSKYNPSPPIGLKQLKEIVNYLKSRDSTCPIIAISGIDLGNVDAVLETGVDGVAVVSAICESEDPKLIAQQFRNKIGNCHSLAV